MAENCPEQRLNCPYAGTRACIVTKHHLWWPKRDYATKLEQHFRNLDENIEMLRRCDHDDVHEFQVAPQKPTTEQMLQALGRISHQEAA